MKQFFENLNIIDVKNERSLRKQKMNRRRFRFISSSNINVDVFRFVVFIMKNDFVDQINNIMNNQNKRIDYVIDQMNNMKTFLINFTVFFKRIENKLNKLKKFVFQFHHKKQRDKSSKFDFIVFDIVIDINKEKRFKIVDVDYFDFYLSNNYDKNDVITSKKKLFIEMFFFSLSQSNS